MNTQYKADVVINRALAANTFTVWMGNDAVASFNNAVARDVFIAGCSARKLSVYDVVAQQFICGDVGQMEA